MGGNNSHDPSPGVVVTEFNLGLNQTSHVDHSQELLEEDEEILFSKRSWFSSNSALK